MARTFICFVAPRDARVSGSPYPVTRDGVSEPPNGSDGHVEDPVGARAPVA